MLINQSRGQFAEGASAQTPFAILGHNLNPDLLVGVGAWHGSVKSRKFRILVDRQSAAGMCVPIRSTRLRLGRRSRHVYFDCPDLLDLQLFTLTVVSISMKGGYAPSPDTLKASYKTSHKRATCWATSRALTFGHSSRPHYGFEFISLHSATILNSVRRASSYFTHKFMRDTSFN